MKNQTVPSAEPVHLGYIDALRGWAFFGVLSIHVVQCVEPWNSPVAALLRDGAYGVQLFFVVSALTLFLSLDSRRHKDRRPFAAFFVRRLFRVLPLFWLATLGYLVWYGTGPRFYSPDGIRGFDVLATLLCLHGWHPGQINAIVPGGWSIAVELNFYLLVPLLYFVSRSLAGAAALFVVCMMGKLALDFSNLPDRAFGNFPPGIMAGFARWWLPSQLPIFALGIVAYHLVRRPAPDVSPADPAIVCVIGAMTILTKSLFRAEHVTFGVGFVLLVYGLSRYPFRFLVNRFMRYIGTLSFSCYLIHFAVLDLARNAFGIENLASSHGARSWLADRCIAEPLLAAAQWPKPVQVALLGIGVLGATLPLSMLTYRFVEQPAIRAGKWSIRKLGW